MCTIYTKQFSSGLERNSLTRSCSKCCLSPCSSSSSSCTGASLWTRPAAAGLCILCAWCAPDAAPLLVELLPKIVACEEKRTPNDQRSLHYKSKSNVIYDGSLFKQLLINSHLCRKAKEHHLLQSKHLVTCCSGKLFPVDVGLEHFLVITFSAARIWWCIPLSFIPLLHVCT